MAEERVDITDDIEEITEDGDELVRFCAALLLQRAC